MLRYLLYGLLSMGIGVTTLAQDNTKPDFLVPLKLTPVVSGSFGELRSNHFHSGLDLTTNGKTGYNVYASDKGSVSRIKVSSGGYGRAIYINHPGGYTTVYGHLESYAPGIDSIVKAKQYEQKSYEVELFFKKGELPVERGEVIAYSGNSGSSGGPHLHYEIRDTKTQKPVDPLFFRSDIKDDVRPQIQGVKLYPLSDESTIKGKTNEYYSPTIRYNGEFHPKGWSQVKAYGLIGLGIQVVDYLSGSWRKCGVSSIKLFVNDSLVFYSVVDKFSFAESRYINAHIDYAEKIRTGKVIQRSYLLPNNPLNIYRKKNSFTIDVQPLEIYNVKYVVSDATGNTSILTFKMVGDLPEKTQHLPVQGTVLDYRKPYTIDTLGLIIEMPAKAFYENVPLLIHKKDTLMEDLLSPLYTIGDYHIPIHKYITFAIPVADSLMCLKDKLCMAGVTATGNIYSRGGNFEDGYVKASTRNFGTIALTADTIAPVIEVIKAPQGYNYTNRKSMELRLKDGFSGIEQYECLIDGKWALFEYDAKTNRLIGAFKNIPIEKGPHRLTVNATDRKGNESQLKIEFTR